jgi:hypothetical protein
MPAGCRRREGWQRFLRRSVATLRADKYQLLQLAPGLAQGPAEAAASKRIDPAEKWLPAGRVL